MLPLVFTILMMISAWAAWRRNPLYSTRSTLRSGAVVLLAIGGLVGLIIAVVHWTGGKSPIMFGCTIAAAIVFGTLALVFIIQAVTVPRDSKPAALPRSVKLVTTNREKIYKGLKVFGILILVFALGGLLPGPAKIISLTLGGFTLFLAVIMLPIFYFTSRTLDQALTETELSPWVHWHYTAEQWQQWSDVQAERTRAIPPSFVLQRDWRRFLFPFAIIIGGVAFFAPGSWLFKGTYVGVVCAAILALAGLSGRGGAASADKLHAHLLKATPEAYFGRDGVFCDGVFTPWLNVSSYLVSAQIDERTPRSLAFNFVRSIPNPYGSSQEVPIHQSVLIPAGAESDLARLQRELTARCPQAQVSLV